MNALTNHLHELAQRIAALSPTDQIALFAAALFVIPGVMSMALTAAQLGTARIRRLVGRSRGPLGRRLADGALLPMTELLHLASRMERSSAMRQRSSDPLGTARNVLGLSPGFDQVEFLLGVTDVIARVRLDADLSDQDRAMMLLTLIDAVLVIDQAQGWGQVCRSVAQLQVSNA